MTLTSVARAIGRTWLRPVLIVAMALTTGDAAAQRPSPSAAAVPAGLDSLYRARRFFELRDSLSASGIPVSPALRFYAGMVAHAFNDNDAAIANLRPIVDSLPRSLSSAYLVSAADALGDSYRRQFRYRESGAAYTDALRRLPRAAFDSTTRARFTFWASVAAALVDAPPQRIEWTSEANNTPVANDSVLWAMQATVNGDTLAKPLAFEVAAPLTVIDSTSAAMHHVRSSAIAVRGVIVGHIMPLRIGLIDALSIGPAVISNVAVLVAPDDSLRSAYHRARLGGAIGLPVVAALGTLTLTRDGRVALSSPGVAADTNPVPGVALVDGSMIVAATYAGSRIPLALNPTASSTLLYPPFLQQFAAAGRGARLTTHVGIGPDGEIASRPAYVISDFAITLDGRTVQLGSVDALMGNIGAAGRVAYGTLGQDALKSVDRATLNFASMTLRLRDEAPTPVLPQLVYPTGVVGGESPVANVPQDIAFVILIFALFVVPKALQRYRLPSAITSLLMGAGATALGLFHNDPTLHLLSTFGIVALFLFAGLEIDGHELRRQASPLLLHGLVWTVLLAVGAAVASLVFGFAVRPAVLIGLALLTPSTGFILSSLAGFGLQTPEQFAVKTYAIASELLALTVLFFVLQSTSLGHLAFAVAAMIGVVIVIPVAFRLFARLVAPHAPRSEFAFLLMVAIVCAYATTRLGVYYLVGAFIVGVAAQRFRSELPAMSSEKMVDALESFGSVFIPFYFFHAGTEIVREQITVRAMIIGVILIIVLIPCRIAITALQRRLALRDSKASARRVGIALVPTLVFTLVITDILDTNFGIEKYVLGALVLYTVINTTIPAFVLHSAPPEFENVAAAEIDSAAS